MRNTRTFRAASVGLVVLLATVAAACGRSDSNDNSSGGGGGGSSNGTTPDGGTVAPPPVSAGFDGETITVGAISPLTGRAAVIGTPLTAGNQVYFDALNAKGGVAGKYKVKIEALDSKYEQQTAVQQFQSSKDKVAMYVQILGTAIVDAALPQLETDGILAGPASLDAFWVRQPNLMPIGGPYQIQVINGMDYAVRNLDAKNKKLCALTQEDPYGETALAGLEFANEQNGMTITSQATFKGGDTDFTAQINQMQGDGCEIIVLAGLPTEAGGILGASATRNFTPQWLGVSPNFVLGFAENAALGAYMSEHFLLLSEGPQWGDESVPGMKQMLDDIATYAPDQKPDIYFAFGYAQAWAATQILEQAVADGDLSPAGVLKASEEISELTFGGLLGDYAYGPAADRNPPRESTVFAVDPSLPAGLRALETNFASQAAKDYEFEE